MPDLVYRGSRADLARAIRAAADAVTGRGPDPLGLAGPALTRGAVALLSKIQGAFAAKARGGAGDDGIVWKPLAPSTIARRRTSRRELKALGLGGGHGLKRLTDAQKKRWRDVYRRTLANLRARGVEGAEARAQGIAWGVLKRAGVASRRDVLAGRSVEILRDTGLLYQSLTPGYETAPARPPGQVLDAGPGRMTVGTTEKPWHHAGSPRAFPARPLWPPGGNLPQAWWDAVTAAVARGLTAGLARALTRRGG